MYLLSVCMYVLYVCTIQYRRVGTGGMIVLKDSSTRKNQPTPHSASPRQSLPLRDPLQATIP